MHTHLLLSPLYKPGQGDPCIRYMSSVPGVPSSNHRQTMLHTARVLPFLPLIFLRLHAEHSESKRQVNTHNLWLGNKWMKWPTPSSSAGCSSQSNLGLYLSFNQTYLVKGKKKTKTKAKNPKSDLKKDINRYKIKNRRITIKLWTCYSRLCCSPHLTRC